MAEQWSQGYRVVKILWTEDRAPRHALDLPTGPILIDPDDHIAPHELPISREEAMQACWELNDETLCVWMERDWYAVFEVREPIQFYGQIEDDNSGSLWEDWTILRAVSLAAPTAEEISRLCTV